MLASLSSSPSLSPDWTALAGARGSRQAAPGSVRDADAAAGTPADGSAADAAGNAAQGGAAGAGTGNGASGIDGQLTEAEQQEVAELKKTDRAVRAHEQAHMAAGGGLVQGGAAYDYQKGPDGKNYAVGGEVGINTSEGRTPQETVARARKIQAAALAPADPSGQDRSVAARAAQMEMQALREMAQQGPAAGAADAPGKGQDPATAASDGHNGQGGNAGAAAAAPAAAPSNQDAGTRPAAAAATQQGPALAYEKAGQWGDASNLPEFSLSAYA
jgi:hypothetical protein